MTDALDYASSSDSRRKRPWKRRALWIIAAIVLALLILWPSGGYDVESSIDGVTGTMRWQTTSAFGSTPAPRIDVSPLEKRLTRAGIAWSRNWRPLHLTHRSFDGRAVGYECSTAPPIYSLRLVLEEFASASTDNELRLFVNVMQNGTDAEQQAAVDAACEKGLAAMNSDRPGANPTPAAGR